MRGISREVFARGAAWSLAEGACKDLTAEWGRWEATYSAAMTGAARESALLEPAGICAVCPITLECADLAELSGYTGIAAGQGSRTATATIFAHARDDAGRHDRADAPEGRPAQRSKR